MAVVVVVVVTGNGRDIYQWTHKKVRVCRLGRLLVFSLSLRVCFVVTNPMCESDRARSKQAAVRRQTEGL